MAHAVIGVCTIEFYLPGVASLKEKRSILKSMLKRVRNAFNVAAAEIDYQDVWQSAKIGVATVTNSNSHANQTLSHVLNWIETNYPDAQITHQEIEIL